MRGAAKSITLAAGGVTLDLVEQTEFYRADAGRLLNPDERAELGQFLTPPAVARFMASLSGQCLREVRLDGKRRDELKRLFAKSSAPLVFVTAFMDRSAMVRFLGDISWETEVRVAEAPSHMIRFNGERFLGPYED